MTCRAFLVLVIMGSAWADQVTMINITPFDFPDSRETVAWGINNAGDITGQFTDAKLDCTTSLPAGASVAAVQAGGIN